jgi:hypothetical protein
MLPTDARKVAAAWERFAAGDDAVEDVRAEILLSWKRCRDDLGVEPSRQRAVPVQAPPPGAEEAVVAAELGAAAASIVADVRAIGGVVAVADGHGRVLGAWGDVATLRHGREQNLDPMFVWREGTIGTTGLAIAGRRRGAVAVERAEHWCAALHDWSCAAAAVTDPRGGASLGAIDITVRGRSLPPEAVPWLTRAADAVQRRLDRRLASAPAPAAAAPPPRPADRVVGLRGRRMHLLSPAGIRLARLDAGTVWLDSDAGRFRSVERTLEDLEGRLGPDGFLRVNRTTLVNLGRVVALEPGFKGSLWVVVDGCAEPVAVSRRRATALRAWLGL